MVLKKLYQNDLPFELKASTSFEDVMIVEAEKDWICVRKLDGKAVTAGGSVGSSGPLACFLCIEYERSPIDGRICIKRL